MNLKSKLSINNILGWNEPLIWVHLENIKGK